MIEVSWLGERALSAHRDGPLLEANRGQRAIAARVRLAHLPEVADIATGARTVLVTLHDTPSDVLLALLREDATGDRTAEGPLVEVGCRYDGEDLDEVGRHLGASTADVIELHTGSIYEVAFVGFSPGFPYLIGLPPALAEIPRLATPRTRVPAGSVAIAGGWTGIYPQATPGGWHLLGRTDASMLDPSRAQPVLLQPGDRVRFVEAR